MIDLQTPPRTTPRQGPPARPVSVCFMIDGLAAAGTESQLVALINNLDRSRVLPHLVLLDGESPASRALEPAGCPILRLGVRSLLRPRTALQTWRLAQWLRRERIDVLQMYFPDSTYVGVAAGRLAGVPCLVRSRHNMGHDLTPTRRVLNRLCRPLIRVTVANCHAARRSLLAEEALPGGSVVVLENGVDFSRFRDILPPPPERRPGPRRIGIVANLRPVKGLEVLIDAAARLMTEFDDLEFRVAGEGDSRPALEQRVRERGLVGQFHLPGSVRDIPDFLANLDVAVLCSHSEGMSNAVLEYMAAGRPVVATNVGATGELIEDSVSGLLVPPGRPEQLAEAIARLLRDPATAARFGEAARERAFERYSREAMVRRYEDFYLSLAGAGPAAVRISTEV